MDKKLKTTLIKQAQENLVNNPKDCMHEITHHYRTFLLAKEIANNITEQVDSDLLELFCWWHDVRIPDLPYGDYRVAKVVSEYLAKLLPAKYQANTLDSIENHEFGSKPSFTEGKILQDADKLEVLSEERIRIALDAVEAGLLDKHELLASFNNVVTNWLPKMPERYNFEYSKNKHFQLLARVAPEFDKLKELLTS